MHSLLTGKIPSGTTAPTQCPETRCEGAGKLCQLPEAPVC